MWHATSSWTACAFGRRAALALLSIFLLAGTGPAGAHGGLAVEADKCVLSFTGTKYRIHFTGYQPNSQQKEFCEDIPERGRTIVALDYFSPELRQMDVELRVIRNPDNPVAETTNVEAITELYISPQKHPTGTLNFEHDFKEGKYIGLLKLRDGAEEYTSRFPFAVGVAAPSNASRFSLMFMLLLVGGAALIWARRTRHAH
jgi:hypothetical protein